MPSVVWGPVHATVAANDSSNGGAVAWTNPINITRDGDAIAASAAMGFLTYRLYAHNWGFFVPSGATINGVKVEVTKRIVLSGAPPGIVQDTEAKLIAPGGSPYTPGDNKAIVADWAEVDEKKTYGGAADTWGTMSLPASDPNDASFGFILSATVAMTMSPIDIHVGDIVMTLYYTGDYPPRGPGGGGDGGGGGPTGPYWQSRYLNIGQAIKRASRW